ncbi:MAG TPA: DUF58 domain-containing protein [Bacteroidales bacterium]|nr:DUF58 domain-containing protein [Bacteroidales bacterium]
MEFKILHDQLTPFGSLELLARQVVEGFITGMHKSPFHGFSVEFAEHRLYNRGESIRHIDWKLFGRTEKLFVKRFEEETNLRCQLVIDCSGSMLFPLNMKSGSGSLNKLAFSVYAAASLSELMRKQRDAVGLSLFDDSLRLHTRARTSRAHHQAIFVELERLLNQGTSAKNQTTAAAKALHEIAERTHQRSLVVIFSDLLDNEQPEEVFRALQHLRYNKHEVILFHVLDKATEELLDLENRPYRFVDMETGEALRLNPVEIQDQYRKAMAERKIELRRKCAQYRIDLIETDISRGYHAVLVEYLIKRSRLY